MFHLGIFSTQGHMLHAQHFGLISKSILSLVNVVSYHQILELVHLKYHAVMFQGQLSNIDIK